MERIVTGVGVEIVNLKGCKEIRDLTTVEVIVAHRKMSSEGVGIVWDIIMIEVP